MFYEIIYLLLYVGIILGSYVFLGKAIRKQVGPGQFTGVVFFVTVVASVMMPGVILAFVQMILYVILFVAGAI